MVNNIVNSHLNNLLSSTSGQEVDGWNIECNAGIWDQQGTNYDEKCHNWYGWKGGSGVGSISTTLFGGGRARLNFGNCWAASSAEYVDVYLGSIHNQRHKY